MDQGLIAWGRAVKRPKAPPPLWLFTDAARLPNPLPVIARLPRGLCGVVFRHDAARNRAALARRVAALCQVRGVALVVAGDAALARALGAGVHARGGAFAGRTPGLVTASAHTPAQVVRARRAGADLIFISPVFPTGSHPGAPVLGPVGWRALAALAGSARPCALGGITGANVYALGRRCAGIGAIDAFASRVGRRGDGNPISLPDYSAGTV